MTEFIRRRELDFQLFELFALDATLKRESFSHLDRATVETVLDTAIRVANDHFASNADFIDAHEPEMRDGKVEIDDSVQAGIEAFAEAGFIRGGFGLDDDGMGLPQSVVFAYMAIFNAANVATAGYGLLTIAAAHLLETFGSAALKDAFFQRMLSGDTLGTMCLSEPDAGSSLGDLRTRAVEQEDGTYRLFGNKMWISGAGHDLTPNILHFVLARIDGAPDGSRGISLFAVPRYLGDGDSRRRNDVHVAGLNHKMGYRGITNCALNFGESEGATGWLVGEPHRGLRCMFQMMNEARVAVGVAAAMSAHNAYLYALEYAKDRKQGRHPDARDASTQPVAIIEHADVRHMLLQQRVYIEGAWALCTQCGVCLDDIQTAPTDEVRRESQQVLDLLTPIAKAWSSKYCLVANELAIQVLGGYGYSREYPVERHYRDNRLNAIHEGTNGIQAMDLLGRKVAGDGGAGLQALMARMERDRVRCAANNELVEFSEALGEAMQRLTEVSMSLGAVAMGGAVRAFLANATTYLDLAGHVVIAWCWLRMAEVALAGEGEFYDGKLVACRYFYRWELPKTVRWAELLLSNDDTALNASAEQF